MTLGVRWSLTYATPGKNLGFMQIQGALKALVNAQIEPADDDLEEIAICRAAKGVTANGAPT